MSDSQRATPIGVKSIDHVTFVVADLERSRAFYEDLLGMEATPRPNFSFPGLWFRAGATYIHLILEHGQSGLAGASVPAECTVSRTRHVAFGVDDADAAIAKLTAAKVEIVAGPKQRPDGVTQLYVFDPDGNLVELFAD